ncbi:MAG: PIN domain-containing protein [Sporolactobacillus sp.]
MGGEGGVRVYYVFLDTNVFTPDFRLNKMSNRLLLKYSQRNEIIICLTYTNYLEIIKKFKDFITPLVNKSKEQNALFVRYSGDDLFKIGKAYNYVEKYKQQLDKLIGESNIEIVHHSSDIAERIIPKFFNNIKPFDFNKPSFRDAFIWETMRDFNQDIIQEDDRLIFITNNSKDFAKKDKDGNYYLHDDLKNEIPNLVLYTDANDFFNRDIGINDYLIDNFEFNEGQVVKLIEDYAGDNSIIQSGIDEYLWNNQFEGEYFEGWGEDAQPSLTSVTIVENSLDVDNGDIQIIADLEYEVDFSVVTSNPGYEKGDPYDDQYLRDNGNIQININCSLVINDEEIKEFSIEGLE